MGLSAERIREMHTLLWAQCDGGTTHEQHQRLERLVCEDPLCREFYVRYMHLHAGLYWDHAGDARPDGSSGNPADAGAPPFDVTALANPSSPPSSASPPGLPIDAGGAWRIIGKALDALCQNKFAVGGALIAVAAVVGLVTIQWRGRHDPGRDRPLAARDAVEDVAMPEFIAKITGTTDCRWTADANEPIATLGSHLAAGRTLKLAKGVAEITFHVGAKVLLEGPSHFEIKSPTAAFLHSGKLTARVPERAHGFVVDTPSARVVDLGTEFGVEAAESGETEVYVFRGLVELVAGAERDDGAAHDRQRLAAGEAQRFTATGHVADRPLIDPDGFARELWNLSAAPIDRRDLKDGLIVDFEGDDESLGAGPWYVSGGMNATRRRTNRRSQGIWGFATDGTGGSPDAVFNVKDSVIDGNTSMAWGPFFIVNDPLPEDAKLLVDIAGSSAPWSENVFNGPAGMALWDLSARDFARTPSSDVVFVHPAKNTFTLEPAEIPLAGLEGKTLGIVLVDRRCLHWGWVAVDNVRSTPGAVRTFVGRRHHATIVEDFDDHGSFNRWHGDQNSFQLGRSGASGHTQGHVNHRPNADGSLSIGSGYLSSKTTSKGNLSRGQLSSPPFVLDGDILEFYLAGTGDRVAFQLVAVEADGAESVIASATTRSAAFTCRYWPIHPGWVGRTVCVRLVDDAADGYIEVDAVRVVRFNVPGES